MVPSAANTPSTGDRVLLEERDRQIAVLQEQLKKATQEKEALEQQQDVYKQQY